MKGRLQCHLVFLLMSGILFLTFSAVSNFWAALTVLCILAVFVFFSQSTTFGIVPYVNPENNGMVSGIVGAAGTAGGLALGFLYRDLKYTDALYTTGILLLMSSFLTLFLVIPGQGSVLSNEEMNMEEKQKDLSYDSSSGNTVLSSTYARSESSSIYAEDP